MKTCQDVIHRASASHGFIQQRVVVVAGFVVRVDGFRIDRIERRTTSKALHQIRVGDKRTPKRCRVCIAAFDGPFRTLPRQPLIEDVGPFEDTPHVTADAIVAAIQRLARENESDVARVELLGDIREQRARIASRASSMNSTSGSDARRCGPPAKP